MKQGHNVVAIKASTGLPYKKRSFATNKWKTSGRQLGKFLRGLLPSTIVVIAVQVSTILFLYN